MIDFFVSFPIKPVNKKMQKKKSFMYLKWK